MGFNPTIYPKRPVVYPTEAQRCSGNEPFIECGAKGKPRNFHNFDIGSTIGGGFDLINNIIGQATGSTQQQLAAQQALAQAQLAQAEADKLAAQKRGKTTVAVVAITGVTLMFITGFALYFKYRKKGASTGK